MTKQDQAKRLIERRRWRDAIPIMISDIRDHSEDPWSPIFLGTCYYELRDHCRAMKCFQHAERLLPDDPMPIGLQADVLLSLGAVEEAGDLYRKALAIDPKDELATKNWNRFLTVSESMAEPGG